MPERSKIGVRHRQIEKYMFHQNDNISIDIPDRELIQKLQTATQDLLWYSESEYSWQTFYWHDANSFNKSALLQYGNYSPATKVAVEELFSFFKSATKQESWHNDSEKEEVRRYQTLLDSISASLTEVKVYLLGEVEIAAYVLGTTKHNAIAGITTTIVRT